MRILCRPNMACAPISLFLFALITWGSGAKAQDLNFQDRIEQFAPEIDTSPAPAEPTVSKPTPYKRTDEEMDALLAKAKGTSVEDLKVQFTPLSRELQYDRYGIKRKVTIPGKPLPPKTKAPSFTVGLETSYRYQSNANTSPTDPASDSIGAIAPNFKAKIPLNPEGDAINLSAGTTATRYARLDGSSLDLLSGTAAYTKVLGVDYLDDEKKRGPQTIDSLTVQVGNNTSLGPGFDEWKGTLTTFDAALGRRNIPLSQKLCKSGGSDAYCHYMNLSARAADTLADNEMRNNVSARATVAIGWVTPIDGVVFESNLSISGRHFTHDAVDRDDAIYTASGTLSWQLTKEVALVTDVQYTIVDSTINAASWDGFEGGIKLKVDFDPCPADKKK